MRLILHILLFAFPLLSLSCSKDELQEDSTLFTQAVSNANLKILAIGNSFTEDATFYLPQVISASETDETILVGLLILGGSSLEQHWNNHLSGNQIYRFSFTTGGEWHDVGLLSLDEGVNLTNWDIVTLQQVSGLSGIGESYHPYVENLELWLRSLNSTAEIGWQMTWAYSSTSNHDDFVRYDNSRQIMYNSIISALDEVRQTVDFIIPSGMVIEEMRNTSLNDSNDLTRDGYHLNRTIPCLALSCLWGSILINPEISNSTEISKIATSSGINISASNAQLISSILTKSLSE